MTADLWERTQHRIDERLREQSISEQVGGVTVVRVTQSDLASAYITVGVRLQSKCECTRAVHMLGAMLIDCALASTSAWKALHEAGGTVDVEVSPSTLWCRITVPRRKLRLAEVVVKALFSLSDSMPSQGTQIATRAAGVMARAQLDPSIAARDTATRGLFGEDTGSVEIPRQAATDCDSAWSTILSLLRWSAVVLTVLSARDEISWVDAVPPREASYRHRMPTARADKSTARLAGRGISALAWVWTPQLTRRIVGEIVVTAFGGMASGEWQRSTRDTNGLVYRQHASWIHLDRHLNLIRVEAVCSRSALDELDDLTEALMARYSTQDMDTASVDRAAAALLGSFVSELRDPAALCAGLGRAALDGIAAVDGYWSTPTLVHRAVAEVRVTGAGSVFDRSVMHKARIEAGQ